MMTNSTPERSPAAAPDDDRDWPALIDRGVHGLLADLVSLARRAIDTLADELIRRREADRSKAIDNPAPVPVVNAQPKPVKQRKPRTPKPERKFISRPRECRLYVGKMPRGLSRVECAVVKSLDRYGFMNRTELQRDTGCCYRAVSNAAFNLCQRRIAECDTAYQTCFRLIDPVPAGVQCEADD
jgi:hypothetical protein